MKKEKLPANHPKEVSQFPEPVVKLSAINKKEDDVRSSFLIILHETNKILANVKV